MTDDREFRQVNRELLQTGQINRVVKMDMADTLRYNHLHNIEEILHHIWSWELDCYVVERSNITSCSGGRRKRDKNKDTYLTLLAIVIIKYDMQVFYICNPR